MKPEIIASLIGIFVTALATIIVALIQNQSKKSEKPSELLVPEGYKVHHPRISKIWRLILPLALLGGVVSYLSYSWFYNSDLPQAAQTASELPTITPSATSTIEGLQADLLSKDCINSKAWFSLDNEVSNQGSNCLSLDNFGIFAEDNGLAISSINDSAARIRHGISTPIEKGTQIKLKLTISELYTPKNDDLANLSLGIISKSSFSLEDDTLLIYQRESPQEGYPILVKKEERGGIESYLSQNGGHREYAKNTVQEILLDVSGTNQLTIYIDGSPVIQAAIPFDDKVFWIGYRLSGNCLVNAEISELQIQKQ
jgi:hypothetical protein